MECEHRGKELQAIRHDGNATYFFACNTELKICSPSPGQFKQTDGSDVPLCSESCPLYKIKVAAPKTAVGKATAQTQGESPPKLTMRERAKSLVSTLASTAVTGLADDVLIESRLAICETCPQFVNNGCKLCGCKVNREKNLLNKLAHISSVCPDKINPRW